MQKRTNGKRTRNIFDPASDQPFKISRTKIEEFLRCARCFYLDRRLGVGQPPGFPFNLNSAVDHLLKKEFDVHRAQGTRHPLMEHYNVDAVPFVHDDLDRWRENFVGVQYLHGPTNFIVTGAVDDIWVSPKGELAVVDYKATSKDSEVNIDAEWQRSYKNQMEIYQWLLRHNGFWVSDTGYFVYVNGRRDKAAFDGKLEFDVKLIPYTGSDAWVEKALLDARACLTNNTLPQAAADCEWCHYREAAQAVTAAS
ncbi:MAG: PD-(D/E)XK nuclease family protein [Patescibacteria group bacterium]